MAFQSLSPAELAAPTPADIGLPFPSWRPGQWPLLTGILESEFAHHLLIAPTGFGKSALYMGMAQLCGGRTVILTATKALQDQLVRDFHASGLYDIRGKSGYLCTLRELMPHIDEVRYVRPGTTTAQAPCSFGFQCPMKQSSGCPYYDRVRHAPAESLIVTNYDFWLHGHEKLGDVDLLVMDEAHQAPDELADFLSFHMTAEMRRTFARQLPEGDDVAEWRTWARGMAVGVNNKIAAHHGHAPEILIKLKHGLEKIATFLSRGEWVVERMQNGDIHFDCVNPEAFGQLLWGGVAKTVLVSATANKMTAQAIGINLNELKEWEAKSSFPVESRPVWVVDGAVQVNFRMVEGQKRQWVNLIDRLLSSRSDRKGIVHTTSFERARYLQQYSANSSRLLLNESKTTKDVVANFKASKGNLVLVSPSVTTGYDFPYSECEFQIIGKIPFPDLRTKAAKVRSERNKEWAGYMAAQQIVQSSGRGMRAEDDMCETFIVDGNFGWWWRTNRKYTPRWWGQAVQWTSTSTLPPAPPRLGLKHNPQGG